MRDCMTPATKRDPHASRFRKVKAERWIFRRGEPTDEVSRACARLQGLRKRNHEAHLKHDRSVSWNKPSNVDVALSTLLGIHGARNPSTPSPSERKSQVEGATEETSRFAHVLVVKSVCCSNRHLLFDATDAAGTCSCAPLPPPHAGAVIAADRRVGSAGVVVGVIAHASDAGACLWPRGGARCLREAPRQARSWPPGAQRCREPKARAFGPGLVAPSRASPGRALGAPHRRRPARALAGRAARRARRRVRLAHRDAPSWASPSTMGSGP